jgi:zinc transport system substrate-binding protein
MRLPVILLALALAAGTAAAKVPNVVVSIAPIHSLVASVMQGVGEPTLLPPEAISNDATSLQPSVRATIAAADLVVWVGPPLEKNLVAPLNADGVADLELLEAPGIDPRPDNELPRDKGAREPAVGKVGAENAAAHVGADPHFWLDPLRAEKVVEAVAETLADMDARHAREYRKNAATTVSELEGLDPAIRQKLAPVAGRPFAVLGDGYAYFVHRYGLNEVGPHMTERTELADLSAVDTLRNAVAESGAACVFVDGAAGPDLLHAIASAGGVRVGVLNESGVGLIPGPALYDALLTRDAEAIASCLAATS